ncbi:myristoyl-CoA:protein N-myristoyltransferase, putative [Trichomonas vaginalis G3]|uniref:Glycylpeptide N-tetradecanoyltransferase n=1 Tax=Trichomonas vaginalis (strain ATCC PRA-98 / G3) TaxID=412133 RepID=A2G941_TRIV3|nr:N-myristoyl transferase family [Trichomonas vaginalis G3]EAX86325.1 myristoyl-CoA:protein N-myristoyltransferase, putative [Trichomonas vaginalis G3]KAI5552980.1 N-myristoyl transferase family [Trichomonas vaginalis G3]|eukprot:XP_001299255.1 myristoyl-CoA:protein N-myristoyltransferase [Trichomonas vaginalis G3]
MSEPKQVEEQNTEEAEAIHKFWSVQPVVKEDAEDVAEGYIDPQIPVTAPPDQPSPLPAGFTWSNIDINDEKQLQELYHFLEMHYIENDQHSFRFCLPAPLLKWAIAIPGGIPEWVFGVRTKTGTLVGFISGIPNTIRLNQETEKWCTVNFLCVHNKLRSKKLAQVLIWELARRVRQAKIYRAVFSGKGIPTKIFAKGSYAHRPINLKNLSASGYYPISKDKMAAAKKRFEVPSLVHNNCRPMKEEDIPAVTELLNKTDSSYKFSLQFTPELVKHMFMPQKDVIYSYVIPGSSGIQGFFSFYLMAWTILSDNFMKITFHKAAYSFYMAATIDLKGIVSDLINRADKDANADIITGLQIAGWDQALSINKFEKGSNDLEYYSYNYGVPPMEPNDVRFLFI